MRGRRCESGGVVLLYRREKERKHARMCVSLCVCLCCAAVPSENGQPIGAHTPRVTKSSRLEDTVKCVTQTPEVTESLC